jgi:ATP-binding cassette subfamily F protein 3
MILLSVDGVRKHFGPEPVLDGVSFEVRPGDKIGLVGPNGAGKTTLMKILAGQEQADAGSVVLHSSARLEYLEQQPDFLSGRTLWDEAQSALDALHALSREYEDVAHALAAASDETEHKKLAARFDRLQHELERHDVYNLDRKVEQVLDGLGFPKSSYAQQVETLSGGQQNRLLLGKLLLADPDLMLLDEPSNHLDIEATEWLENFLSASRQAIIVVSHDRYFLDKVTNRTLELFHGTVDSYSGNFSAYWRQKDERLEVQRRTYEKQQEEIAKLEDFIRRNAYGQKHAQAKDREKKLERIERVELPREIESPPMSFPKADRTGDIVLRAEGIAKAYDRPLFSKLSFDVPRAQRWGMLGPNGSGKTTLLRCAVGQETFDEGRVVLGQGVRVGYYDQLLHFEDDDTPVVEAVRPAHKEFNDFQRRDLLAKFGLKGDIVFQRVGSLSGGERSRAALARLASSDANFLVLDEPTNHLDLWARDALERAILNFNGTVLFVSHDRYFLNRVADHLLVVDGDRFRVIEGNYELYLHFVREGLAGEEPAAKTAAKAPTDNTSTQRKQVRQSAPSAESSANKTAAEKEKPVKRKRKFPYRKVADLEAEIFERESRVEQLHADLANPDILRDGNRVRDIQSEITEQKETLKTLYEHWEEATELNPS